MSKILRLPFKLKSAVLPTNPLNVPEPALCEVASCLSSFKASDSEILTALAAIVRISPESFDGKQFDVRLLLRFATSPHNEVRSMARIAICHFAEFLAPFHKEFVPTWKEKVMEVVGLDSRTTRFVQLYPRIVDLTGCLAEVGKWLIQDDPHELVRFFLFLELESHIPTRRRELSDLASDFVDFCGYSYFRDCYPEAVNYLVGLAEGECLPRCEQPSSKTFSRLCAFKQHDKLAQIMLAAVVAGDLDRVDWFTRNLFPEHFSKYGEYEISLMGLLGSESMPREVRENAISALMFLGDEHLNRQPYFEEFISLARFVFSHTELELLCMPDVNPKTCRRLLGRLALVR